MRLCIKFVTALATWVFIASADFSYIYIKCEIVVFGFLLMRVAAVGLANIACTAGLPFGNRPLYAVY